MSQAAAAGQPSRPSFSLWKNVLLYPAILGPLWLLVNATNTFGVVDLKDYGILGWLGLITAPLVAVVLYNVGKYATYGLRMAKLPYPPPPSNKLRLIIGHKELREATLSIVNEAEKTLVTTGSRSRDGAYLQAIVDRLANHGPLTYYRVLFGNPYRSILKDHLQKVLEIRDPRSRAVGFQNVYLSVFTDAGQASEWGICGNENRALVILPPISALGNFDTAVMIDDPAVAEAYVRFVHELYMASTVQIMNKKQAEELPLQPTVPARAAP